MSSFTKTHLRFRIYPARTAESFVAVTGSTPTAWRACGVRFSFTFMDVDSSLLDVGNIASVTLFAKTKSSPASSPIILKTSSSIDTTLNLDRHQAGEDHVSIDFSAAEMAAFSTAAHYDLTLAGLTTDDLLDQDVFGFTDLEIKDAGVSNLVSPAAGSSPAVTMEQLTAILGQFVRVVGDPGSTITLRSADGLTKRILGISNAGERQDDLEQ